MKPWLWLPASLSSKLAPSFLPLISCLRGIDEESEALWRPLDWLGLHFRNPMGIAGGVDKDAESVSSWWKLGAGFLELGTITPQPQKPNPGKILSRNNSDQALWNKMGFPSKGAQHVAQNLRTLKRPYQTPLFLNIGKNRDTPNEAAHEDYIQCLKILEEYADAFVINISSPNTKDLRKLLEPQVLKAFLTPICETTSKPLLLKISPDLSVDQLQNILNTSLDLQLAGWILTNTTTQDHESHGFPNTGGLSGKPLAEKSKHLLIETKKHLGDKIQDKLLISAGGVITAKDVLERLELGAHLVQTYSGLIFNGPFFFQKTIKEVTHSHVR